MSSTKAALLAPLLVCTACAADAKGPAPQCPAVLHGAALKSVSVFDGPFAEMADLVPDGGRKTKAGRVDTWDLGYVYKAGRHVFLRCDYGKPQPVEIKLTVPVKACALTQGAKAKSLSCK
ncbi:STY0301 family protein [Sphingomonas immobilis]|uniref:Lipoprotein n=1 Tax=Sphingomonas immobilis TaxID=3063997 RepID=A0ABT8ZZU2_9SPHN|nr:STY0301 family protein [Sphingomonas sp. CA1-15]MDO7842525.1 hypothetical protein [Sphingomonas sp. CA1-15]